MVAANGADKIKNVESKATLDEAMLLTGFGLHNIGTMLLGGFVLMGLIMESMGLSYIMPAAECELGLQNHKGWLGAIPFIGIILTSHTWGYLADTQGRRPVLLWSMVLSIICSVIGSFSPNLWSFALLRLIASMFLAGPSGVSYAYIGEFNSSRHRDKMVTFGAAFVGIATVVLPAISWLIIPLEIDTYIPFLGIHYKSWRLLIVACAVPYFVCAIIMVFAPETPKFLLADGKEEECLKVVRRIYALNQRSDEQSFPIHELIYEGEVTKKSEKASFVGVLNSMADQTVPLFRRPLLGWTALACFVQMGCFAVANGFYVWFPTILNELSRHAELTGETAASVCEVLSAKFAADINGTHEFTECDDTVNPVTYYRAIIIGLVFCSMYIIAGITVDFVGKKNILMFVLSLSGACGVAVNFTDNQLLAISLFAVFQMAGSCVGIMNAVAVDLFPTKVRAMAVSLSMMSGRVGSVIGSNVVGALLGTYCPASFYLFGGILIVCAALCVTLPGKHRPQPVLQSEQDPEVLKQTLQ